MRLVMAETNEGAAENNSGGGALALKIKNLDFYWPTMNTDSEAYAKRCDQCERHAPTIHCPTELLLTMTALYPFMRWGYGHNWTDAKFSTETLRPGLD